MVITFFSKDCIHIDIKDSNQDLIIFGDMEYTDHKNISTNFFNPNIMGPFSYIPFMECNHAILSMKSKINGLININDRKISFNDDIGYLEKDWGSSFPKSYIWAQGNDFKNSNASFMISIADVPLKKFHFKGIICVLIFNNKEFRFTTYNNTKLVKYDLNNNLLNIILKKGRYYLTIHSKYNIGLRLSAPIKGKMEKDVYESICATISVTLKKDKQIVFSDTIANCGLEIVR